MAHELDTSKIIKILEEAWGTILPVKSEFVTLANGYHSVPITTSGEIVTLISFEVSAVTSAIENCNCTVHAKAKLYALVREYKQTGRISIWNEKRFADQAALITDVLGLQNAVVDAQKVSFNDNSLKRYSLSCGSILPSILIPFRTSRVRSSLYLLKKIITSSKQTISLSL